LHRLRDAGDWKTPVLDGDTVSPLGAAVAALAALWMQFFAVDARPAEQSSTARAATARDCEDWVRENAKQDQRL